MIEEFSGIGAYHMESSRENQDAVCHAENKLFSCISLADGVSDCVEAKTGADIASGAITNLLVKKGDYFLGFTPAQTAELTLSHILFELKRRAGQDAKSVAEYSSTIASVLVDRKQKKMLCFNLGDSMIMGVTKDKCCILAMPQDSSSGCCVTTTKNAERNTFVKSLELGNYESVIICSDGAWKTMFNRNRLKPEISDLLIGQKYDQLKKYLAEQKSSDDYSYISLKLGKNGRKSA